MSLFDPRALIRQRITDVFNDADKGERPVLRRADALFAPDSTAWKVNGDVVTMMIGGVSGLLLQMLHPAVLAGVWDHSDFRADMHGRLRRTAKFIAVTTYDHAEAGRALLDKVNRIHAKLRGTLPECCIPRCWRASGTIPTSAPTCTGGCVAPPNSSP